MLPKTSSHSIGLGTTPSQLRVDGVLSDMGIYHQLTCSSSCAPHSLAVDAEVIVGDSERTASIDGHVQSFMDKEIVPRALPDDAEIVNERKIGLAVLESGLEAFLRNARGVICLTRGLADARDTLRLKMENSADIVAVDRERNQRVERTGQIDDFASTSRSTRDEYRESYLGCVIGLDRRMSRDDGHRDRQHYREASLSDSLSAVHNCAPTWDRSVERGPEAPRLYTHMITKARGVNLPARVNERYRDISPNITGRFAAAVNHASPAPWFENLLRPGEVGQLVDQLMQCLLIFRADLGESDAHADSRVNLLHHSFRPDLHVVDGQHENDGRAGGQGCFRGDVAAAQADVA